MKTSDRTHSSKIGYILFPMLLFTLVFDAASAGISSLFSWVADERGTEARNFLLRNAGNVSAVCTAISAAIAFLAVSRIARKEVHLIGPIENFSGSESEAGPVTPDVLTVMAAGIILFSFFLNAVLSLTGAVGADPGADAASRQTGNVSLLLGILVYGILTPFCEEIVFRGITFQRSCRAFSSGRPQKEDEKLNHHTAAGIVISSLLFGVYHGNLVQGFYAFCMGVLFCLFVLKCKRFYYVIILHGSVNLVTLIASKSGFYQIIVKSPVWMSVLAAGALLCGGYARFRLSVAGRRL